MKAAVTVKENYEFRRIYRKGKSLVSPQMVLYWQKNRQGQSRLGITVSTKLGHAVVRNRCRRRLREVSIVQLRTQTGKPQLALLRLNAPFTGKRAPFGQQLRRGAEMAGEQTALLQLRPVDAHGHRRGFVRPDAYRKAARRKRQILQQEMRQITLAHRHHERELRLLLLLGHGLDRFGAVRRRFALRPSDQHPAEHQQAQQQADAENDGIPRAFLLSHVPSSLRLTVQYMPSIRNLYIKKRPSGLFF